MTPLPLILLVTLLGQAPGSPGNPGSPPGTPGERGERGERGNRQLQRFQQLDRNGDGVITRDEMRRSEIFDSMDADKDGEITMQEAREWASNNTERTGQRPGQRPGQRGRPNPGQDSAQNASNMTITRDIVYVKNPDNPKLQSLDIYSPKTDARKPVMIYIHGGGWQRGDKETNALEKAELLEKLGWMLVCVNYRLSPAVKHPEHIKDVAAAVAWVHDNIADHGGNPEQIVVMGHSAGAHLAALVSIDPDRLGKHRKSLSIIDGAILLDGAAYDLPRMLANPRLPDTSRTMHLAWAGRSETTQADASPALHVRENTNIPPFLILHTDRAIGIAESNLLGERLEDAGVPTMVLLCEDETHTSMNQDLGTPDHKPTEAIRIVLESLSQRN